MNARGVDLREEDLLRMRGIFARFSAIHDVRVFGSRATGEARRASDIDLAVRAPSMSPGEWARLRLDLEDAPIPYEVDVVNVDEVASASLLRAIEQTGVSIYNHAGL